MHYYLRESNFYTVTYSKKDTYEIENPDRSSDSTIEIVKSFACKVSFPVHLHLNQENLGTIKNFEKAISLCTGDIIAQSDQDDVWKPNKIEKILTAFAENIGAGYVF